MIDDNNNDLEQGNGGGGNMGRVWVETQWITL